MKYLKSCLLKVNLLDTTILTISILFIEIVNNFISSLDNDEEHVMYTKRYNIEIMINDEQMKLYKNFLKFQLKIYMEIIKNQQKVSLPSITFIYCIINVIK